MVNGRTARPPGVAMSLIAQLPAVRIYYYISKRRSSTTRAIGSSSNFSRMVL
jgi:hypothetical protein